MKTLSSLVFLAALCGCTQDVTAYETLASTHMLRADPTGRYTVHCTSNTLGGTMWRACTARQESPLKTYSLVCTTGLGTPQECATLGSVIP